MSGRGRSVERVWASLCTVGYTYDGGAVNAVPRLLRFTGKQAPAVLASLSLPAWCACKTAARGTHCVTSTLLAADTHRAWCPFTLRVAMGPVPLQEDTHWAGAIGHKRQRAPQDGMQCCMPHVDSWLAGQDAALHSRSLAHSPCATAASTAAPRHRLTVFWRTVSPRP